jgi:hypothetical protein
MENRLETLRLLIREYYMLFDQYRQYLKGHDFKDCLQESTSEPSKALESLQEMNTCLQHIKNNSKKLIHALNLNHSYTSDQLSEANKNLLEISGYCDTVNRRIHLLGYPDVLLITIHKGFMDNLAALNLSIIEYNKNQTGILYTIPQALKDEFGNDPEYQRRASQYEQRRS